MHREVMIEVMSEGRVGIKPGERVERCLCVSALSWGGSDPGSSTCVNTGVCGRIYTKMLTVSPQGLGQEGENKEIIIFFFFV